jgi:hypothetical protein
VKRLAASLLLLALVACGRDAPKLTEPNTVPTTNGSTIQSTPTSTAQTTTSLVAGSGLVPPDSQTPAAGTCPTATGGATDIVLSPDIPNPRCTIVHETDHLRVTNHFDVHVFVDDGGGGFDLATNESYTVPKALGGYWAFGVHRLKISNADTHAMLYGGSGPEVWLQS